MRLQLRPGGNSPLAGRAEKFAFQRTTLAGWKLNGKSGWLAFHFWSSRLATGSGVFSAFKKNQKTLALWRLKAYCLDMEIDYLATVTLGEVFDPADMPDETAAMENAPEGWNDPLPGLEEITR
jgi:hypothetical protein